MFDHPIKTLTLNNLPNIIVVSGDDYFLCNDICEYVICQLDGGKTSLDFNEIEGEEIANISDHCRCYSFTGGRRVVYIDLRSKLLVLEKEALANYIASPSSDCVLLIYDEKNELKEYYNKVEYFERNKMSEYQVIDVIVELAKLHDIIISRKAGKVLAQYTMNNMTRISKEVEKLCLYVMDKGEITAEDVKECVYEESEHKTYELTNAIIAKDKEKAIEIYFGLKENEIFPLVILAGLIRQYRLILHVSLDRNKTSDNELAKILGSRDFVIRNTRNLAGKVSQKYIKGILDKLYKIESDTKSGKLGMPLASDLIFNIVATMGV